MKRIYVVMAIISILISLGFDTYEFRKVPDQLRVICPSENSFAEKPVCTKAPIYFGPFVGRSLLGFKEAMAFKESGGDYFVVNDFGYMGKYQFGLETLKLMGVYSQQKFLNSPKLQEEVFYINLKRNKWILRKDIKRSTGRTINNIMVTESGILAAAHLAGAGNVKKYLRSKGQLNIEDAYGTSLSDYLRDFSGYDMSKIIPFKNPKISSR